MPLVSLSLLFDGSGNSEALGTYTHKLERHGQTGNIRVRTSDDV